MARARASTRGGRRCGWRARAASRTWGSLLQAGISAAPEIANVLSPYVGDPGNYFRYGAALVFQWKLDLLARRGAPALRRRAARGDAHDRAAPRSAASGPRSRSPTTRSTTGRSAPRRTASAVSAARRWLILVSQGIDVGHQGDRGPRRAGEKLRAQQGEPAQRAVRIQPRDGAARRRRRAGTPSRRPTASTCPVRWRMSRRGRRGPAC